MFDNHVFGKCLVGTQQGTQLQATSDHLESEPVEARVCMRSQSLSVCLPSVSVTPTFKYTHLILFKEKPQCNSLVSVMCISLNCRMNTLAGIKQKEKGLNLIPLESG